MDQGLLLNLARDIEAQLNAERQANKKLTDDFNYNYALLLERDKTIDILEAELNTLSNDLKKEKERAGTAINQLAILDQKLLHYDITVTENKSLKTELHKARLEIADLSQKLSDTTIQLQAIRTQESEATKKATANQIIIERYEMQHKMMEEKAENAAKESRDSKEEAEKARLDALSLHETLVKLQQEVASLQIERDSLRKELENAQSLSAERQRTTKSDMQHKITTLQRELQLKEEDLERSVAKYKHDVEELRLKLCNTKESARADLEKAEELRKKAEKKVDELSRASVEYKAKIEELLGDISVLKSAIIAEKRRTASLQSELQAQQTDVEGSLRKRALDAEKELQIVKDDLAAKVVEISNLNATLSKLTIALQIADQEATRLKGLNAELERAKSNPLLDDAKAASLQRYEDVIKDMKEQMRRAAECSRTLELENNSYKAKLEEISLKLEELQQDHDRVLEKNKRITADKETIALLQTKLAEIEVENDRLKKKIALMLDGESVEPDSIELLRKMQVHMKLAANMIATLKEQNQSLNLKNNILNERLKKYTYLDFKEKLVAEAKEATPSSPRASHASFKGSPTRLDKNSKHSPRRMQRLFEEDATGRVNMDRLSDLPSNISVLESLSEMSVKLQDILRDAYRDTETGL
ncbi:Chromosome segregation protein SMC [Giardia duodenalis]|uniref:Chromosome segregation protein SMC n=1 Tax=Giardia intestinalis TaxID=5741 RepID=V6TIG7_GIAIN|nr:Chromosome segregation protein SMC [Giardia intestinalis]